MHEMRIQHVIYATKSLRKFLIARAMGAPREELLKLSAAAMAELEAERAARPTCLDDVVLDFNQARAEREAQSGRSPPDETP